MSFIPSYYLFDFGELLKVLLIFLFSVFREGCWMDTPNTARERELGMRFELVLFSFSLSFFL